MSGTGDLLSNGAALAAKLAGDTRLADATGRGRFAAAQDAQLFVCGKTLNELNGRKPA